MGWKARLALDYSASAAGTRLHFAHDGPLRVLKSLYPEGPGVCHNVLVHPPGGLVSGDDLCIDVTVSSGAHALISTPGATRFYKAKDPSDAAHQRVKLTVAENARLEWVPLETIAFAGCHGHNGVELQIAAGGQMIGWDVLTLGLPAADQPFDDAELPHASRFAQSIHWPGHWHERALIRGDDARLMNSHVGLAGQRSIGTLWFASGSAWKREQMEQLAEALRASWANAPDAKLCGCTWLDPHLLVVRSLGPVAEPVMQRMQQSWALLRQSVWGLAPQSPRIWAV